MVSVGAVDVVVVEAGAVVVAAVVAGVVVGSAGSVEGGVTMVVDDAVDSEELVEEPSLSLHAAATRATTNDASSRRMLRGGRNMLTNGTGE